MLLSCLPISFASFLPPVMHVVVCSSAAAAAAAAAATEAAAAAAAAPRRGKSNLRPPSGSHSEQGGENRKNRSFHT